MKFENILFCIMYPSNFFFNLLMYYIKEYFITSMDNFKYIIIIYAYFILFYKKSDFLIWIGFSSKEPPSM